MRTKSKQKAVRYDKTLQCYRHSVEGLGDCGYLAFGIERNQAQRLLLRALNDPQHSAKVVELLYPAVAAELLMQPFHDFLQKSNVSSNDLTIKFESLMNADQANQPNQPQLKQALLDFAKDPLIVAAYLDYDICQKQIQGGWSHVAVLLALAQTQGIAMHLWEIDAQGKRVPHSEYPVFIPEDAEKVERKDLLFIDGKHFELIELDKKELAATQSQQQFKLGEQSMPSNYQPEDQLLVVDPQPANVTSRDAYVGLVKEREQFEALVKLLGALIQHTASDRSEETAVEREGIEELINNLGAKIDSEPSSGADRFLSLFREAVEAVAGEESTFADFVNHQKQLVSEEFDAGQFKQRFKTIIDKMDPRHQQKADIEGIFQAFEAYRGKQQQLLQQANNIRQIKAAKTEKRYHSNLLIGGIKNDDTEERSQQGSLAIEPDSAHYVATKRKVDNKLKSPFVDEFSFLDSEVADQSAVQSEKNSNDISILSDDATENDLDENAFSSSIMHEKPGSQSTRLVLDPNVNNKGKDIASDSSSRSPYGFYYGTKRESPLQPNIHHHHHHLFFNEAKPRPVGKYALLIGCAIGVAVGLGAGVVAGVFSAGLLMGTGNPIAGVLVAIAIAAVAAGVVGAIAGVASGAGANHVLKSLVGNQPAQPRLDSSTPLLQPQSRDNRRDTETLTIKTDDGRSWHAQDIEEGRDKPMGGFFKR